MRNTFLKSRIVRIIMILAASYAMSGFISLSAQPSQALTENWRSTDFTYNGKMLETDVDGNAYVLGDSPATLVLNIRKYSASGILLWQSTYDDPVYNLSGVWLTLDPANNVIVLANIVRSTDGQPAGLMTLKYDTNGNLLWANALPQAFTNAARAIASFGGDIYVAGTGILIKYSPSGAVLWQDTTGTVGQPFSMATSTDGLRIGIAGKSSITGLDFRVVMYDNNGNRLWTNTTAGVYPANDIAIGGDYSVYLATGAYLPQDPNTNQMAIVKLDAAGNLAWSRSYPVGDNAYRIALSFTGGIVVTGVDSTGYLDWMTIKTDFNGNLLWAQRYDGTKNNDETPNMLKIGLDGGIYVTGKGGPSPSSGTISNLKGVVVKYNQNGTPLWAQWDDYAGGKAISLSKLDPMGTPLPFVSLGWGYLTTARYINTDLPELSPAAPTNLTASLGYRLNFTDNANNEFWVEIERCTGDACTNFVKIGQTKGENATAFDDTTTQPGNTYNYRVRAVGFMGASAYSNSVTLVTPPVNPPAAPSNLSALAFSKSQINLAWVNNDTNQTGVKIERCRGATCTNFAVIATTAGQAASYADTGLASNATYRYRVSAYNSVGNSPYSNIAKATTLRR